MHATEQIRACQTWEDYDPPWRTKQENKGNTISKKVPHNDIAGGSNRGLNGDLWVRKPLPQHSIVFSELRVCLSWASGWSGGDRMMSSSGPLISRSGPRKGPQGGALVVNDG